MIIDAWQTDVFIIRKSVHLAIQTLLLESANAAWRRTPSRISARQHAMSETS